MDERLKIKKHELETEYEYDYLLNIAGKYENLMKITGKEWIKHFTDDQHGLYGYIVLYTQVQNGGFVQLIWNGYYGYIFETPLTEMITKWGAPNTAKLLEKIKTDCNKLAKEIGNNDKTDIESFSKLYKKHPEFEAFDKEFYDQDEYYEVKNYVEKNLSDFIILE
ncbi:DMP19 family protein [Flavobacterium sp. 22076]|jgi:hypothetical protein|uniref:DMP19 family protein n=1 Tax=unclassified Flavobacterium TaxID=196869 RepID=UPI003F83152E